MDAQSVMYDVVVFYMLLWRSWWLWSKHQKQMRVRNDTHFIEMFL